MADLFQGSALPATVSTTQAQETAPEFYSNYLQDIASLGQQAVQQAGVAGFSPLQQQALQMAPALSFAGSGTLGQAAGLAGAAGTTMTPDILQGYMNPYQSAVVDEMGRLTQRNVMENVMPALGGAAAASGQFGSKRQADITGQTLRDIQADLLGRQYGALQSGYDAATKAAQQDLQRQLQSGQALENIGQQQFQVGTGGLNQLFGMGAKEQQLGQTMMDYPMAVAQNYAKLFGTPNIPMGRTTQTVAPGQQGQYGLSGLQQIATLAGVLSAMNRGEVPNISGALVQPQAGQASVAGSGRKAGGSIRMAGGGTPTNAAYHDGQGNYYDEDGYLVG